VRRTLFDQNVPRALGSLLPSYAICTAAEQGWGELQNGDLLKAAEAAGFSLMVTCDQNIQYQQNLGARSIALVVLSTNHWATRRRHASRIAEASISLTRLATPLSTADCRPWCAGHRRRRRRNLVLGFV
jgi:hypothetical protein